MQGLRREGGGGSRTMQGKEVVGEVVGQTLCTRPSAVKFGLFS